MNAGHRDKPSAGEEPAEMRFAFLKVYFKRFDGGWGR